MLDSNQRPARACKACWVKANPQVDYKAELDSANSRVKELAGLLATEKQGREYDRALFRTEAESHKIAVHRLEKEASDNKAQLAAAETVASEARTQLQKVKEKKRLWKSKAVKLQSDWQQLGNLQDRATRYEEDAKRAAELLQCEQNATASLREKVEELQNQLNGVREYYNTELKLLRDDYEEANARLTAELAAKEEALKTEKLSKQQWKKQAEDHRSQHEKSASKLSELRGDYSKLLSKQKQLEENEQNLLRVIETMKDSASPSSGKDDIMELTLQLKETATRAAELQAENEDLRGRVVPEVQLQVAELTKELAESRAATESEEREKTRMHIQLQEALRRTEEVRRELSKKGHAELKAELQHQQDEACLSCHLM